MKRISYKSKLLLYFTLLFAVFTALLVLFQYNREKLYKRDLLNSRLRSYADVVSGAVDLETESGDTVRYEDILHILPHDLRLTVINRKGKVMFESTHHNIVEMNNHLSRPEVQLALNNQEGSDIRLSDTDHREYFYYAKTYNNYIVRVALPYDAVVQNFMKADNVFLWFVLMLFPIAMVILIHISDRFGKAVTGLKNFIISADRGLVDYDHIAFPHSELGDVGNAIMQKYKQLELSNKQIALERERLKRHFNYVEEGIAIFTPSYLRIYANAKFMQYVNMLLEHPTPNIQAIWHSDVFAPITEFLNLNAKERCVAEDTPIFRYNVNAGSNIFAIQTLIYSDGSFEISLSDVTKAEKNGSITNCMGSCSQT